MVIQRFQDVLALLFECFFLRAFGFFVVALGPSSLQQSLNLTKIKIVPAFLAEIQGVINLFVHYLMDFVDDKLSLLFDRA